MHFLIYSIFFLISLIGTYLLVPYVNKFGLDLGIVDIPREDNIKNIIKARTGGIAIFIPYIISIFTFYLFFGENSGELLSIIPIILIGSFCVFLTGLSDDVLNLSYWPRLTIQIFVSSLTWFSGLRITNIDISFLKDETILNIHPIISFLFTIIWITGLINAINWMDGLDGLAASLISISSLAYLFSSHYFSAGVLCFLSSSIIGCCIGFLFFNKYPAKILMGDSGSYLLGFNIAVISLVGSSIRNIDSFYSLNSINFNLTHALLILAIPIFDMVFVISNRILRKRSPFYPDRNHIHHRLLRMGINKRISLYIICSLSIIFSILANNLFI